MKVNKSRLQIAMLAIAVTALSGCFHSDDDDEPMVNNPPSATSIDTITQTETAFTDNFPASDPDSDALTFSIESQPTLGDVTVNTDGSFTYQPFNELTGTDSFTFQVTDSGGLTASGTVGITIEALQVPFTQFVLDTFAAAPNSTPVSINGREFIQDGVDAMDYQDLIDNN